MNEEDERREEIGRGGVEGEGEEDFGGMFQEPSDFRPPPPLPTNHAIQRDPQFVKPGLFIIYLENEKKWYQTKN